MSRTMTAAPNGCETAAERPEYVGRFVRSWITGELEEVPAGAGGRQIIHTIPHPYGTHKRIKRAWHNRTNIGMSLKPEEATFERIKRENAEAKHHGTGTYYTPDGICHTGTRGNEAREMRRRGYQNNDGGYGDYVGR